MKESYTIDEVTDILDLRNPETVRRYIRKGKGKSYAQLCNDEKPALELVDPNKRPYNITRRSLELVLKRNIGLNDVETNNLLTNYESLQKADIDMIGSSSGFNTSNTFKRQDNSIPVANTEEKPAKKRKKHRLFGIKGLTYSYNGLSRTIDKLMGKSEKDTPPNDSPAKKEPAYDVIEKGNSISVEVSGAKESAEYLQKVLILTREIKKSIEDHDREIDALSGKIQKLEEELAKYKQRQKALLESKKSLLEKQKEVDRLEI